MNRKIILSIVLVVAVSGCVDSTNTNQNGDNEEVDPVELQKGLEIKEFRAVDPELRPGQQTNVVLKLENYHVKPINIENMELYNLGFLEKVSEAECTPTETEPAKKGYIPTMECSWRIEAPPRDEMDGFNSKSVPVKLDLTYSSQMTNAKQPLQLHFRSLDDIDDTSTVSKTYSNNEVSLTVETEDPVPFEQGRLADITVQNAGMGKVKDNAYEFNYTPSEVFNNCNPPDQPFRDKVEFSCMIEPQNSQSVTRNLFFSVSYKYVKSPTLDIGVVDS